jgi:hypothetical protein
MAKGEFLLCGEIWLEFDRDDIRLSGFNSKKRR